MLALQGGQGEKTGEGEQGEQRQSGGSFSDVQGVAFDYEQQHAKRRVQNAESTSEGASRLTSCTPAGRLTCQVLRVV